MDDTRALTLRAEQAEAAALVALMRAPSPAVAAPLGIGIHIEGDAVAGFVAAVDALSLNRLVGLGVTMPATEAAVDRILVAARKVGVKRLLVQLAPTAAPPELGGWLQARGAVPYNRWVRLWRSTSSALASSPSTDLRVARVHAEHALEFARVVRVGFDMPESLDPWLASTVDGARWQHYAAWDGAQLVATGAFYLGDRTAWFGLAATLESHRGHGAQSALIIRRFQEAAACGCDWVVAETAEQRPDHSAPSYRNLLRLGFTEAYLRQNFVITLPSDPVS